MFVDYGLFEARRCCSYKTIGHSSYWDEMMQQRNEEKEFDVNSILNISLF